MKSPHPPNLEVELCVDTAAGARIAREAGADRIELCSALELGGLTPSQGLIEEACAAFRGPVIVLLRPRAGDFVYDASEMRTIERDLDVALRLGPAGVRGIAFGALDREGRVDVAAMDRIHDRARPLEVTFHRAFDAGSDPLRNLDALLALGVDRLLSSGAANSAATGSQLLRELVSRAGTRLSVMPGGGVTAENARAILVATGAREIHASAGGWSGDLTAPSSASRIAFRAAAPHDAAYRVTVVETARAIIAAARANPD